MSVAARARRQRAPPFLDPPGYARHRPAATLLYQLVEQHHPAFRALRSEAGRPLPGYIEQEFDAYLKCGRLEEGFLRLRCNACHAEKLVAFSCKKRGFCPSCGARRMTETAALLAEGVLPERPLRQWVLSLPHALRFLLAGDPEALTLVLAVMYRTISRHLIDQVGLTRATGATGGVAPPARTTCRSWSSRSRHASVRFWSAVVSSSGTSRTRGSAPVLLACRLGDRAQPAREARTVVPLCESPAIRPTSPSSLSVSRRCEWPGRR